MSRHRRLIPSAVVEEVSTPEAEATATVGLPRNMADHKYLDDWLTCASPLAPPSRKLSAILRRDASVSWHFYLYSELRRVESSVSLAREKRDLKRKQEEEEGISEFPRKLNC